MKEYLPYKREFDHESYQTSPSCIFCGRETETMIAYELEGYQTPVYPKPVRNIPVHAKCFRRRNAAEALKTVLITAALFALLCGAEMLIIYVLKKVFTVPGFLIVINDVLCLLAALVILVREKAFTEDKIKRYINSHTDHEDYYKDDRRKRW